MEWIEATSGLLVRWSRVEELRVQKWFNAEVFALEYRTAEDKDWHSLLEVTSGSEKDRDCIITALKQTGNVLANAGPMGTVVTQKDLKRIYKQFLAKPAGKSTGILVTKDILESSEGLQAYEEELRNILGLMKQLREFGITTKLFDEGSELKLVLKIKGKERMEFFGLGTSGIAALDCFLQGILAALQ